MSTTEPSAEEAARELAALEAALEDVDVAALLDPPECADTPRNRTERRARKAFRRREAKRGKPKGRTAAPPKREPASRPDPAAARPADMPHVYLRHWADSRGPLFEDPAVAACRALALGAVTEIALCGADKNTAGRAGRYAGEHARHWPHAKSPATGAQFAAASALIADLTRAARKSAERGRTAALHNVLQQHYRGSGLDAVGQLGLIGWARLLAGVLDTEDEALRVRCARTLLAWTVDDARKVGRGNPEPADEDEREMFDRLRMRFEPEGDTQSNASPPARPAPRPRDSHAPT